MVLAALGYAASQLVLAPLTWRDCLVRARMSDGVTTGR